MDYKIFKDKLGFFGEWRRSERILPFSFSLTKNKNFLFDVTNPGPKEEGETERELIFYLKIESVNEQE